MVLLGSQQPISKTFCPDLLAARYHGLPGAQEIPGEVNAIFTNSELALLLPSPKSTESPVNSLSAPHAYFAYTHFRGRFIEEGGRLWQFVLRRRPLPWALALVALLLLATCLPERSCTGSSALFWSSWVAAMTMLLSLYLFQSIVGQAYWLVAMIVAGAMAGIWLGAHPRARPGCRSRLEPWASGAIAILPLLFAAPDKLTHVPPLFLAVVLLAVNVLVCWHLGTRLRLTSRYHHADSGKVDLLFFLDLLGASGGLIVGAVILPWWCGFRASAWICAIAASCAVALSNMATRGERVAGLREGSGETG